MHGENTDIDLNLKKLTLSSIKRLRDFTNGTLLDILLYSSPVYCQRIIDCISVEIERVYQCFTKKYPDFGGRISLAGHSLGSLILFDLLCNQTDEIVQKSKPTTQVAAGDSQVPVSVAPASAVSVVPEVQLNESIPIEQVLKYLNIDNSIVLKRLKSEEITDFEGLELLAEDDLINLKIPLGFRKKILKLTMDPEAVEKLTGKSASKPTANGVLEIPNLGVVQPAVAIPSLATAVPETSKTPGQITEPIPASMIDSLSILNLGAVEVKFNYQQNETGIGQPSVKYPKLPFKTVDNFFSIGSPISMFLAVRGVNELGLDFQLPTCQNMFNIFHPFDPVAYRIEPLVFNLEALKEQQPHLGGFNGYNWPFYDKPVLIPHHTGRKRFHLELKENITKMGTDLKNSIVNSMSKAMSSINNLIYGQQTHDSTAMLENLPKPESGANPGSGDSLVENSATNTAINAATNEILNDQASLMSSSSLTTDNMKYLYEEKNFDFGMLNNNRRIDYVLQERPLEAFNDYLFAFQSHLCYWESEDVVLMMLKEIYKHHDIVCLQDKASHS